jgi:peroxisomal 3,2-trans-enoyl-CoA isomerase
MYSGADVSIPRKAPDSTNPRAGILYASVPNNLHITHAFYTHPKILVAALNGPCVGLSAAIVAHADFIYAAPHTFLLTPFSSLGLVSEGLAAQTFVQRLGISKANEALIQSKRLTAEELVHTGFINKIIDGAGNPKDVGYSDKFLQGVLKEVDERMGSHLSHSSMLEIKKMIKAPYRQTMDAQGAVEVFGLMDRFLQGISQKEFAKVASGQKKHKL